METTVDIADTAAVQARLGDARERSARRAARLRSLPVVFRTTSLTYLARAKARNSTLALGTLLTFLLVGQWVRPGFTHYWGYQVFQVSATLLLVLAFEAVFARAGGLSSITHAIVAVTTIADSLGTAGHMYDTLAAYDKFTHFGGGLALSAVAYDLMRALNRRGALGWAPTRRLLVAVMTAFALGAGWEVYEYLGDHVFQTARVGGFWDTTYDLISDLCGAVIGGVLLWHAEIETRRPRQDAVTSAPERSPATISPFPSTEPDRRCGGGVSGSDPSDRWRGPICEVAPHNLEMLLHDR